MNTSQWEELANRLQPLIDRRLGIVHQVGGLPGAPGDPYFYKYYARLSSPQVWAPATRAMQIDGGFAIDIDRRGAYVKAVCEALERYSGAFHGHLEDLQYASPQDLPHRYLTSKDFHELSDTEAQDSGTIYSLCDPHLPRHWVTAKSLTFGDFCYVPADLVYIPFPVPSSRRNSPQTTSGLALGSNIDMAVTSGLLEVLERDAFMVYWLAGGAGTPVRVMPGPKSNAVLRRIERAGLTWRCTLLTVDHCVPVAVATVESVPGYCGIGASAALTLDGSVSKALLEAEQCRGLARDLAHSVLNGVIEAPTLDEVNTPHQHVIASSQPEVRKELDQFMNADAADRMPFAQPGSQQTTHRLSSIVASLHRSGHEVLFVETTTRDVEAVGVHCVRVLVTNTQPLVFGKTHFRGSSRLGELAESVAGLYRPSASLSYREVPHPFS